MTSMGERTYADTVARGFYGKNHGGLFGKYDNVRAYWEDELTKQVVGELASRRRRARTKAKAAALDGWIDEAFATSCC